MASPQRSGHPPPIQITSLPSSIAKAGIAASGIRLAMASVFKVRVFAVSPH
jgi:hypothetical protein